MPFIRVFPFRLVITYSVAKRGVSFHRSSLQLLHAYVAYPRPPNEASSMYRKSFTMLRKKLRWHYRNDVNARLPLVDVIMG
jgi:hypothetical protein